MIGGPTTGGPTTGGRVIDRRELLFAGGCAAAVGTAEWLRPRERLVLLPAGLELAGAIPAGFGEWRTGPDGDIVVPETPGSLAQRLYDQRVVRSYRRRDDAAEDVMLLAAYGGVQSDTLQLHRPEVCYPAVGFQIVGRQLTSLALTPGTAVPAVMISARAGERVEDVIYWTRLGEALPQTAGAQRSARLAEAMRGYVADGVLVRASAIRVDEAPRFDLLADFLRGLARATPLAARSALIGTQRARALG